MKKFSTFLATLTLGALAFTQTACRTTADTDKGFVPLFDGKTLKGWQGVANHWRIQDGAITGYTEKADPLKNNTFLVWTNGTVDNFELRFRYRMIGGNSGSLSSSETRSITLSGLLSSSSSSLSLSLPPSL